MDEEPVDGWAGWTVAEVLAREPRSALAFIRLHTACPGCPLDRFCTLADVAVAYDLPLADVLAAIAAVVGSGAEDESDGEAGGLGQPSATGDDGAAR